MQAISKISTRALGTLALGLALAVPAAAQFGGPPPPPFTGKPVFAALKGAEGQGSATVVVNPPEGTACYLVNVTHLTDVTAAHIHRGAAGAEGPPVVTLTAPTEGSAGGCATVAADLAQALLASPGDYYVNVHTRAQPNGAIRGQLSGDITRPLTHPK
ncbi:MAG: hypothetical protein B7Z08_05945 [Sphingomonadales bacterium 32-68-7]|nr:MAG: hypothetical protein B7Z33_11195 [Sphingomonadales bacterium 12-68-11]OYX09282.1 MAG: hypothetical protein B7Z08_05945 [Sphingomonadales bacterium 32-68-7]